MKKYERDQLETSNNVTKSKLDGRSLNKSKNKVKLCTSVSQEFKDDLNRVAIATGLKYNQILEESLTIYKEKLLKDIDC